MGETRGDEGRGAGSASFDRAVAEALATVRAAAAADETARPELIVAIVNALEGRLLGTSDDETAEIARSLMVGGEADLHPAMEALRAARATIQRGLVANLTPERAIGVVDALGFVMADLLMQTTDWGLRDLESDAFTDPLTGVGNRRAFDRDATRAVELAKRYDRRLTLAIVDLDGLKALNDTSGHAAGDRALRALTDTFVPELRAGDGIYRIGGDEFAVLLLESGPEVVDRVFGRVFETAPKFSFGRASFPEDASTVDDLLLVADRRLFAGREVRRAVRTARADGRWRLAATALPLLAVVGLAELIRRTAGVGLSDALVPTWIAMLALGAVLGIPVAEHWCNGHRTFGATARCATGVATVVLVILAAALVPVSRLDSALDLSQARVRGTSPSSSPGLAAAPRARTVAPPLTVALPAPVVTAPTPTPAAAPVAATASPRSAPTKIVVLAASSSPTPPPAAVVAASPEPAASPPPRFTTASYTPPGSTTSDTEPPRASSSKDGKHTPKKTPPKKPKPGGKPRGDRHTASA